MTDDNSPDDDAARWALRLEDGELAPAVQAELEAWLAVDPRRAGALLRAEAILCYLDRGRALAGPENAANDGPSGGESLPVEADDVPPASRNRLRFGRRAFVAGGSLMAASLALGLALSSHEVRIATDVGELRKVPLADGSVATVNTASRLGVSMQEASRTVDLKEGEAWFQVAHDKSRPFTVRAGAVRVRAVGTAFSVRRRDSGVDVLVTEGSVAAWVEGATTPTRIAAGEKGFISETSSQAEVVKAPAEVERQLAWRTGEIALNGESLEYAVREINRYNVRQIRIDDQALRQEPIVGYVKADQPEGFSRTVAQMMDARVEVDGETIVITR